MKHRPVLVLNKLWTAIGVASLQRAISLLYSDYADGKPKAQIITPPPVGAYETFTWSDWAKIKPANDEEVIIASCNRQFRVPEVILLTRYEGMPDQKVNFSRRHIYKRDNYQCQYCGKRPGTEELTIDHVVPRSQGGETSWTNCVLACMDCNVTKANRTPKQAGLKLLKEPVKPKFTLFKAKSPNRMPQTWKNFISEAYWGVPLQNDMKNGNIDDELKRLARG